MGATQGAKCPICFEGPGRCRQVQGGDVVDYDIDTYVARLGAILNRKAEQIAALQGQLAGFAAKLREEEDQSRLVRRMPMW